MEAHARRAEIMKILEKSGEPVTGTALSRKLGVTRQVIVQDIAILRAQNARILATPKGYTLLQDSNPRGIARLIAVKHTREKTRDELYTMVDMGVLVEDVIVDHPVYGQLTGQLSLSTREDVDDFMRIIEETGAGLLSSLTDGVHLHTVRGGSKQQLDRLESCLREKGFLLTE